MTTQSMPYILQGPEGVFYFSIFLKVLHQMIKHMQSGSTSSDPSVLAKERFENVYEKLQA